MSRYCAVFQFSTQTGDSSWDRVKTVMECDESTTVGQIVEWSKKKAVEIAICLSIEPLEPKP